MSIKEMLAQAAGSTSFFNKQSPIGATVTGKIIATDVRQVTNFQSGEPETWDNGDPKQQVIITLATDLRDPAVEDDDGTRSVYVKWWGGQRQALKEAVKNAGDDDIRVGGTFTATYIRQDPPTKKGFDGPKVYTFTYQPPSATVGMIAEPAAPQQIPATPTSPAPTSAPAPAPLPAADPGAAMAQLQTLIKSGLTDTQIQPIAAGFGLQVGVEAIAAVRGAMATPASV